LFRFNARFFTKPLTKDLYRLARRIEVTADEHFIFIVSKIGYCDV